MKRYFLWLATCVGAIVLCWQPVGAERADRDDIQTSGSQSPSDEPFQYGAIFTELGENEYYLRFNGFSSSDKEDTEASWYEEAKERCGTGHVEATIVRSEMDTRFTTTRTQPAIGSTTGETLCHIGGFLGCILGLTLASPGEKTIEVSYPVVEGTVVCRAQEATKRTLETEETDTVEAFEQRQAATSAGADTPEISASEEHASIEPVTSTTETSQSLIGPSRELNISIFPFASRNPCGNGEDKTLMNYTHEYLSDRGYLGYSDLTSRANPAVRIDEIWQGGIIKKTPNVDKAINRAEQLGTRAALMVWLECPDAGWNSPYRVDIYIIDAETGRVHHWRGTGRDSQNATKQAIEDFASGAL